MKKIKINNDLWAGISLLFFSILMYTFLIPNYIRIPRHHDYISTLVFPKIVTIVLAISSFTIVLTSTKKKTNKNVNTNKNYSIDLKRSGIVILSLIAYYIFMDIIGYVSASIICGLLIIAVFSKSFRISRVQIIVFLVFMAIVYIFFERMLKVPLPHGLCF